MRKQVFGILWILSTILISTHAEDSRYFNSPPPESKGEMFAPGIISDAFHNHSAVSYMPDYSEVYYSIANSLTHVILYRRFQKGKWSDPEVAPFSGQYSDDDPFVSPDGNKLFFASNRPISGTGKPMRHYDIWYMERETGGWGPPIHMHSDINRPDCHDGYPTLPRNGDLYFHSSRKEGYGSIDIYRSRFDGRQYGPAENLGPLVNSKQQEGWPCISPDGRYILFNLYTRGKGDEGFAISIRDKQGVFQKPFILKDFESSTRMPQFSPDGNYLFVNIQGFQVDTILKAGKRIDFNRMDRILNSWQNGMGNVIWMKASGLIPYIKSAETNLRKQTVARRKK